MRLNHITAVHLAGTNTAIIRSLSTGETTLGPAIRPTIGSQQSVFLFQTKPEVLVGVRLHQACGLMAVVELVGRAVRVPGFTEDEDVVTLAERVREDGAGAEVDV